MRLTLPVLVRCDGYVGFSSLVLAACPRDTVRTVRSVVWHEQTEGSPPARLSSMPPRTSVARGTVFPFSNWSVALRGPIARASRTSRAAAPFSATGRPEKPARAGSEFVVNRYRGMNRTGFRDVSFEFYEIGMSHKSVGYIDGEVVTGIACSSLRHEDEIPGTVIGGARVCNRCRGDKAGGCNHPERRRLH